MTGKLVGKKALVTGGTAGIGKAIATAFAREGCQVALFGTNRERGEKAAAEIGERATFYQVDVSEQEPVDAAVKQVIESQEGVDILVNNAGITRDGLLLKMSEEDWDRVMDVNVKSCYNLCHALARPMIRQRRGKIINIASVVGLTGNAGQVNYAASKGAMIALTKALAQELASRHVNVNCIAPGFIESAMTDQLNEEQKAAILGRIPLKRMGQPGEVAELALFLASPEADYITGQVITVDGGMVM